MEKIKIYPLEEKDVERFRQIIDQVDEFSCFGFEGLLVKGNPILIIKKYLSENPSKKFRTWLIDQGLVIASHDHKN